MQNSQRLKLGHSSEELCTIEARKISFF